MATVSDFTAVSVATADTPLTFTHTFKGGAWLVGAFGNTALVHIRRATGCLAANSPPIPNAPVAGSLADFFPLLPYYTRAGETVYLTPASGTQTIYVIPVFESSQIPPV